MSRWQYYGGPVDGAPIPTYLTRQDYILLETGKSNDNSVVYYYVKCEDHKWFEFAGEVEEDMDE